MDKLVHSVLIILSGGKTLEVNTLIMILICFSAFWYMYTCQEKSWLLTDIKNIAILPGTSVTFFILSYLMYMNKYLIWIVCSFIHSISSWCAHFSKNRKHHCVLSKLSLTLSCWIFRPVVCSDQRIQPAWPVQFARFLCRWFRPRCVQSKELLYILPVC